MIATLKDKFCPNCDCNVWSGILTLDGEIVDGPDGVPVWNQAEFICLRCGYKDIIREDSNA
jgi:hypothetical protein